MEDVMTSVQIHATYALLKDVYLIFFHNWHFVMSQYGKHELILKWIISEFHLSSSDSWSGLCACPLSHCHGWLLHWNRKKPSSSDPSGWGRIFRPIMWIIIWEFQNQPTRNIFTINTWKKRHLLNISLRLRGRIVTKIHAWVTPFTAE